MTWHPQLYDLAKLNGEGVQKCKFMQNVYGYADTEIYSFFCLIPKKSRSPLKSFFMMMPTPWVFREERVK